MSSAALAVGLSISGAFVLLMTGLIIVVCILVKKSPRALAAETRLKNLKRDTHTIKKKAEKKKKEESRRPCCLLCSGGSEPDGPVPDPPFGVEFQNPDVSSVTVIWNEPATEEPGAKIYAYSIYTRFKNNRVIDWTKVGQVKPELLEYRIKNLDTEKKYVFGVSSKGSAGESAIIETKVLVLKRDPVRPGAPTELDCVSRTSSTVTLSWKPPRLSGYSRIHTYYLTMTEFGKHTNWSFVAKPQAFDRYMDYKVTGLKEQHQYRFRVTAENTVGIGPYAESVTITTTELESQPPDRPRGPIKYARISHASITLSWQPPVKDGGMPVSGYAVEYRGKDSKGWRKAGVCDSDKTRHTVPKLPEDVEFIFRVIAINDIGNSQPLTGGKVKTKLLAIPLSRRSSFTAASRPDNSRDTERSRPSDVGSHSYASGNDVSLNLQRDFDSEEENIVVNSPFVPQSDFFNVDETEVGNVSTRHSENKTRHSQFSPLPKMNGKANGYGFNASVLSKKLSAVTMTKQGSKSVKNTDPDITNNTEKEEMKNENEKQPANVEITDEAKDEKDQPVDISNAKEDATTESDTSKSKYDAQEHHIDYYHTAADLDDYRSPIPKYSNDMSTSDHTGGADHPNGERSGKRARSDYVPYKMGNPSNVSYSQRK